MKHWNKPSELPAPLTREQEAEGTRETVTAFARGMQVMMEENADKPGWLSDTLESLLCQVNKHTGRVAEGIVTGDSDHVVNSCINAANFLMMIADNAYREFGGLSGADESARQREAKVDVVREQQKTWHCYKCNKPNDAADEACDTPGCTGQRP